MPDLTLYRADGRGRLNLAALITDGTEFYTADKLEDGAIVLTPVTVVSTTIKRTTESDDQPVL